jgi:hypothetical protein
MKVYLAYARLCYSLVVIVSAAAAIYVAFQTLQGVATWSGKSWILLVGCCLGFIFLSGRAVARKVRGRPLLSQPIGQYQGANFFLMTLVGSFGHLCTAVICNGTYLVITRADEMPSQIIFAIALAALSYLVALWIGEFVHARTQLTSPQSQYR